MKKMTYVPRLMLVSMMVLAVSGCASSRAGSDTMSQIQDALNDPRGERTAPPPEVAAALMPPININLPGVSGEQIEQRFDVRVRRVAVRDFLLGLVDGTPYDVVVPPDLSGVVSLDLKNTTVPEVMQVLRKTHGYEFERSGSSYYFLAKRLYTRIFYVNYLDLKRTGQSGMLASPGQVSSAGSTGTNTSNQNNNQPQTQTTSQSGSFSRISTESVAEFWPDLRTSLQQIVGTAEGRSVTVNPQSGVVVVRGMPAELRAVDEYLTATQLVVQRQVILEARILEVALSDGFQSGINWAAIGHSGSDSGVIGQFGGSSSINTGASNLANTTGVFVPDSEGKFPGVRAAVNSAFGGVFAMGINTADFTAFIEALKTQGEVQVLSSPRVSTVNNQKAVIKVGSDEFYVTHVQTSQTTTATTTTSPQVTVELTPFFSGVSLDVTPQISDGGEVILHVHPSVSEVTELTKNVVATTGSLTLPTAASTIRESDSVIRARNGQVVVIGGLMQTRTQDEDAAVPFLSDIPLLGNLFTHTRQRKRKSELVILLKPIVVDSQQAWQEQLEQASRTFRSLGEE